MLKKILDVIIGIIIIGALLTFMYIILREQYYRNAKKIQCQSTCNPLQAKIMEEECFCKGPDIWFKKGSAIFGPKPQSHPHPMLSE